ncbi:MAG: DUF4410 domain-containing protein [Acidobacteria bacterium]|nr:DUF4410 domain-containing protein [Acidobacteriota bacterium]
MRFRRKTIRRKRITLAHISFILTCTLLITTLETFAYPNARQQSANDASTSASRQPTVAIFRFALQSETTDVAAPSSQVCSQYTSDANARAGSAAPDRLTVEPKILDAISNELRQALSKKKVAVLLDPDPDAIPVGSTVVCGRIFKARKGSAAGRMFGLGLGASHLNAHIVLLSKTEGGFTPTDSFDLKLKGRNLFPPGASTAVVQATIMEKRQNLQGLARKLADKVAKRLDGDMRQPRLAAQDAPRPAKEASR